MPQPASLRNTRSNSNPSNHSIQEIIRDELRAFKDKFKEELKADLSETLVNMLKEELNVLRREITDQRREIVDLKRRLESLESRLHDRGNEDILQEMSQRLQKREYLILT